MRIWQTLILTASATAFLLAPASEARQDAPPAEDEAEDVLDADELDALFRELEAGPETDEVPEPVTPTPQPIAPDVESPTPVERRAATRLRTDEPIEEETPETADGEPELIDPEAEGDEMIEDMGLDEAEEAISVMVPREAFRSQPAVSLRALDKITGRYSDLGTQTGGSIVFGTLEVTVEACFDTPPEYPREAAAFLSIKSLRPIAPESMPAEVAARLEGVADDAPERREPIVFSGWMYASSPGLNALEHPVYDIWVMSCNAS